MLLFPIVFLLSVSLLILDKALLKFFLDWESSWLISSNLELLFSFSLEFFSELLNEFESSSEELNFSPNSSLLSISSSLSSSFSTFLLFSLIKITEINLLWYIQWANRWKANKKLYVF